MTELHQELMAAIAAEDINAVKSLVQRGLDLNSDSGIGMSLHLAATLWAPSHTEERRIEFCRELLRMGADINAVNSNGATPADEAGLAGKPKLMQFLRESGGGHQINSAGLSNQELDQITNQVMADLGLGIGPGRASPAPAQRPPDQGLDASCLSSFVVAVGLVALTWFGLDKAGLLDSLLGRQPETVVTASPTPKEKASVTFLAQAEEAYKAGRFVESATRAEQALAMQKSEGAPPDDVIKTKELIARSYYKAKQYPEACEQYQYLVKQKPEDAQLKKTAKLVRQEFWNKELKPKLAEAEKQLKSGDRDSARDTALEVKATAKKFGFDPAPAKKLLARVDRAEAAFLDKSSAARKEAFLNEVIKVRVTSPYNPMGSVQKMTRREYLRKKHSDEYD